MPSSLFPPRRFRRDKDNDEDGTKRMLFLSTRATAQETKTALSQFTKNRTRNNAKPSTSTSSSSPQPSKRVVLAPPSPSDVMVERNQALQQQEINEEVQSKSLETASTTSTAWSLLESPNATQNQAASNTNNPSDEDCSQNIMPTSRTARASNTPPHHEHHTTTCDNVSLADSSITTEVAFPTLHSHARPTNEACDTREESNHSATSATYTSTATLTSSATGSSWYQRSLKDLVRRDLRSHDPAVMERALQQITLDCWDSATARSLVARAGGVFAIVNLLEDWSHEERVVVAACHALEKLSLDADNELAVAELGGLDVLYNLATSENSLSLKVQEAAWGALQNCTCQCSDREWDTDMQAWAHDLPRMKEQPTIIAHACASAANLCVSSAERTQAFSQAGGIVAMAAALQYQWQDKEARSDLAHSIARICDRIVEEDVNGSTDR